MCTAQPQLEKAMLALVGLEHKLVSIPIQIVLADVWTGLQEWGDCRLLASDVIPKLVNAAAKKGIDSSSRVCVARSCPLRDPSALFVGDLLLLLLHC